MVAVPVVGVLATCKLDYFPFGRSSEPETKNSASLSGDFGLAPVKREGGTIIHKDVPVELWESTPKWFA